MLVCTVELMQGTNANNIKIKLRGFVRGEIINSKTTKLQHLPLSGQGLPYRIDLKDSPPPLMKLQTESLHP